MRHHTRLPFAVLAVMATLVSSCHDSAAPEKPGAPTDISISAGNAQTGVAGNTLTAPIAAKVSDAKGRAVPNVAVIFQVVGTSGAVEPTAARTNGAGIATTTWTLPTIAGIPAKVRAVLVDSLTGALVDTVTFSATVTGGAPIAMQWTTLPSVAPAGSTQNISVTLTDSYGNRSSGATVAWTVTSGGGTVAPATSVADADGVAATSWTLGTSGGTNGMTAKVGTLTGHFEIEGRLLAARLTSTNGSVFGIGRTGAGNFVVSNIFGAGVQTFLQSSPEVKHSVTTGGTPVVVAVDATGAFAYVSNMGGWLDIIDLGTNTEAKQVTVPGAHALALSPGGDRVYVTSTNGWVVPVSTTTRQVLDSVAVPNGPWGIAFRTTGTDSLMYVTARDGGSITEVDTKTMTVLRTFTVGGRPHGLAISPNGQTLYVADNSNGRVLAVSTATGAVGNTVTLSGAFGIAISPDGSTLFVTTDDGHVAVITASSLAITRTYSTDSQARQIIVSPDGQTAWAANEGGWVDIIPK